MAVLGGLGVVLLGFSVWSLPFFAVYGVLYGSASDSRWHECGHGTAFKTRWMNDAVYQIACFMIMRDPTVWRWSHARHHTDTIIVGRDPEIVAMRPPAARPHRRQLLRHPRRCRRLQATWFVHAAGRLTRRGGDLHPGDGAAQGVPHGPDLARHLRRAIVVACVASGSILPVMLIGLPRLYGAWHHIMTGLTQHGGLAEDVSDHRLNCRTVYMNPVSRFIYWNMNYHVEHHMFPMVPYHALPALHEEIKDDLPAPYPSIAAAFAEFMPALLPAAARTRAYFLERRAAGRSAPTPSRQRAAEERPVRDVDRGLRRRRHRRGRRHPLRSRWPHFAIYRRPTTTYFATDGLCTHEQRTLADGLVMDDIIECPKHNGRFDYRTGEGKGAPVCVNLKTYPVKVEDGIVFIDRG